MGRGESVPLLGPSIIIDLYTLESDRAIATGHEHESTTAPISRLRALLLHITMFERD
jgi:hypothetical protein